MKVPLLDVNAQNHPLKEEFFSAFERVFASGQFIMGPEVDAFEKECASFLGVKHALGISSGTDAILLALMALGIGPGDEVLVPTFTFFATAGCVSRVGATPVFVDALPLTFNLDPADAAAKITPRTKAIIPVHLFGQSADMDAMMELAGAHGLKVIEDGAQAIGSRYHGQACGTIGEFGTYSFFPSKNLGGFGDGGLLVTNDDTLADQARILRIHGSKPKYFHKFVGGNFRLDPLQAAMLRVKLERYDSYTRNRQTNAAFYTESLSRLPGVATADSLGADIPEGMRLVLPVELPGCEHIWNQYTLRVIGDGERERLRAHLAQQEIGCEIYYPLTMDQQECFRDTPEASRRGCEVAHRLSAEVISIPIYPELSDEQKSHVVGAIASFLG